MDELQKDGGAAYFFPALTPDGLRAVSTLGLAHMGDAVFELLVRSWLCVHGKASGRELHRACVELVRAESQAEKAACILPLLTKEEQAVYKRGRNAQPHSVPPHATRAQYAAATALEALLGWLYLQGRRERIEELFAAMMEGEQ
ncbi:MAG: ribonuclease III [Oscillibacter sp.]|nr:ribonuclease III [Oscillibacter sp.]